MENNLIYFDDLLVQPVIQSKWEIENNERNQLIEFIESKIISQVKNMFEEKDRIICELLEKQRMMEHKIDKLTVSLEKKDEQLNSLVATINANNEQNEYFINELKEREADGIQIKTIIDDVELIMEQTNKKISKIETKLENIICKNEHVHLQNKLLSDDVKKLDIKSEWVRLQFISKTGNWPDTNNYIKSVKLCDSSEYYPSPRYGKKIKNQDIITEEQYYELDGLILLVAIKKQNNMTHDSDLSLSQQVSDKNRLSIKNGLSIKNYLDYAYDNLILPLPISKNNTFEDAMKIKEDIEKLGGIVQIV
jgi:hypothetical protein